MSDFSALKKSRKNALAALDEQLKKMNTNSFNSDADEYWQPEVDKAGNGYAVIRFLPAPPGEEFPFVRMWTHSFKGPTGKWYIENCLTTLGQEDPVSNFASELWATEIPENQELVRKLYKRRLSYHSNIYIVNDPAKPENNGTVKKFRYGKKIWDKINDAMYPVQIAGMPEEKAVNPFDFWEGANFVLKIRNVEGYRNYDKSEFEKPSVLHEDDSVLESIWKQEYSLAKITAPENFKSYAELEKRFYMALGKSAPRKEVEQESAPAREEKTMDFKPKFESDSDDDDDATMKFFAQLAADD